MLAAVFGALLLLLLPDAGLRAAGSATISIVIVPAPQCADGQDNDGDGRTDFPDDPECASPSDAESDPVPSQAGTYAPAPTSILFRGYAYPNALVSILKDGQVAASGIAASDGGFLLNVGGLFDGHYLFGVTAEDPEGKRSPLLAFPISVYRGATMQVSGILVSPAVSAKPSLVDGTVMISGRSAANSGVSLFEDANASPAAEVQADESGRFEYRTPPGHWPPGPHAVRARASRGESVSPLSEASVFSVDDSAPQPTLKCRRGSLQGSCVMNLVDFSVASFWFRKKEPPADVDMNGDGVVNLKDFSIMAYYWTG